MGYCEKCNQHYDCHYTVHEAECAEEEVFVPNPNNKEDMFMYEKEQQGWPDDMDEEIWNEHFR
jgi:hypothetical protein